SAGQVREDVADGDSSPTNARLSEPDGGIDGDAFEETHETSPSLYGTRPQYRKNAPRTLDPRVRTRSIRLCAKSQAISRPRSSGAERSIPTARSAVDPLRWPDEPR